MESTQKVTATSQTFIRYIQVALFVGIYIGIGYLFNLEPKSYLLVGIPLTLIFQLLIVRQPLHKLWLRDGEKFHLNKSGWIITLCVIAFPIYKTIELASQDKLTLVNFGYYSCAIVGAFGAGYCYSNFTKKTAKDFLLCFGIIAVLRMSWYFFPFIFGDQELNPDYLQGIQSLLTYVPVAFVVEEVVFRGMLDTYIHPSKEAKGLWSAIFISCIWGIWHWPISIDQSLGWVLVVALRSGLWGVFLSTFWRRTGNLSVPAFSHAFVDGIRDTVSA